MAQSPQSGLPSVADVAGDVEGLITRFARGETHAFAFGDDGVPEAVVASYDQYDDLRGEESVGRDRLTFREIPGRNTDSGMNARDVIAIGARHGAGSIYEQTALRLGRTANVELP